MESMRRLKRLLTAYEIVNQHTTTSIKIPIIFTHVSVGQAFEPTCVYICTHARSEGHAPRPYLLIISRARKHLSAPRLPGFLESNVQEGARGRSEGVETMAAARSASRRRVGG